MANGWTLERKARQAELIKTWKPWEKSTGAQTEAGKSASSQNALKHGSRSAGVKAEHQQFTQAMRDSRAFSNQIKELGRELAELKRNQKRELEKL